jgi:hypothetical protein
MRGQNNKAENAIEKWFELFEGNIMAQLVYIDKTTFGYLDSIPKNCGIKIITSNIKDIDKCKLNATRCAKDRPYFEIIQINKIHQRWIGSVESYIVEIGADLKRDALGNSTHTIRKLDPNSYMETINLFKQLWDNSQDELKKIYGNETVKINIMKL